MGKKRSRLSKVCDFCKKRKVKCDLGNPCSTCIKYKRSPCVYSEQVHQPERKSSDELNNVFSTSNRSSASSVNSKEFHKDNVQDELSFLREKIATLEKSVQLQQNGGSPIYSPIDINSPEKLDPNMMIGHNPVESEFDTYNFFDGYSPTNDKEPLRRRNFGPLAWITLLKVDNGLSTVWKNLNDLKDKYKFEYTQVEKNFKEKADEEEGANDIRPYRDMKLEKKEKVNLSKAVCLGLSFYEGGLDQELELVEKIRLVLPKQKVIWLLYKRFFTHLYPAFPFIDEVIFKEQVQKLIGYEAHLDFNVSVKVEKRLDFASLGILLLMLRFSYISLFSYDSTINEINFQSNDPSPEAQQIKYLLNNPVNIDVVNISQLCLNQFNIMRNCNITLMQLALLTRMYHNLAPEDGDGIDGGDARVFNATLIHMAMQLGLHREPDKFESFNDEKINNIGRKIWYLVLIHDFNDALSNGNLISVAPDSFDTKTPFYKPGNENVIDVEMEKITCACYPNFETAYEPLYDLFNTMFKVRTPFNMKDLATRLEQLEVHFSSKYQGLTLNYDFNLNQKEIIPNTVKLKIYFSANYWLASIYLHIFNYYERKKNYKLAYYYLKKIFLVVIYEVMPFFCECISHKKNIFKNSIDLIATPKFCSVAHTSLLVITGLYLRLRHTIEKLSLKFNHTARLQDSQYRLHFERLTSCCELLNKSRDIFRDGVARLSHRYYYAWRITKAQNFLTSVLDDSYFRTSFKPDVELDYFTTDMLKEIEFIIESSLNKIKHSKKQQKPVNLFESSSINSTGSSIVDVNEFKPNPEIDSIWLQMMNHKNDKFNFDNFVYNNEPMLNTPNYLNDILNNNHNQDYGIINEPIDVGGLFENFPVDELFKDFS
ncbi:unnamed protein product [Candida verbasci]|uniref:Zn(2)-C6 fungal-type domain-containing protein n=1 Tax=Candida verbasci TaxID=1227364 RepID=A0A9W4TY21_9ASCO|nr:unnamed protein product [Candida verbasci]